MAVRARTQRKKELAQLKARKGELEASGLNNAGPVSSNISGLSKGATDKSRAPKKKNDKQKPKRHPGLPSEEGQEYYKSYLVHV